jgi:hypothetical protein
VQEVRNEADKTSLSLALRPIAQTYDERGLGAWVSAPRANAASRRMLLADGNAVQARGLSARRLRVGERGPEPSATACGGRESSILSI